MGKWRVVRNVNRSLIRYKKVRKSRSETQVPRNVLFGLLCTRFSQNQFELWLTWFEKTERERERERKKEKEKKCVRGWKDRDGKVSVWLSHSRIRVLTFRVSDETEKKHWNLLASQHTWIPSIFKLTEMILGMTQKRFLHHLVLSNFP